MVAVSNRDFRFVPRVGNWQIELIRLARTLDLPAWELVSTLNQEIDAVLKQARDSNARSPSVDRMRFVFALSVLHDILQVGGRIQVADSEIYVAWPDWNAPNGRELTRNALMSLSGTRVLTAVEKAQARVLFAPALDPPAIARFLTHGNFWLEAADALHSTGISYGTAFTLGVRTWTMPYRDRPGRRRRFIVVGECKEIIPFPVAIGLIEVGDDAPYSIERNKLIGLQPAEVLAWIAQQQDPIAAAHDVSSRFQALRLALLPIDGIDISQAASEIVARQEELLKRAQGRSQTDLDLVVKKRIAYLVRLAQGELAFALIAKGERLADGDPLLREGVRAMRDLTVPRVHMEVTICGALPPFTSVLGGKLVVAFLGHPAVLGTSRSSQGSILQKVFDVRSVMALLPDSGMLALTTKGLYPGHSILYNRAEIPGAIRPLRLRKIGDTKGETASLFGTRTARLAQMLQDTTGDHTSVTGLVSTVYGTGGAKRQRRIESAVLSTGLPGDFVHAGIRRPIYGLRLAGNVEDVIWAGEQPRWIVDHEVDAVQYSQRAVSLWRERWLERALSRLSGRQESLQGLVALLDSKPEE